MVIQLDNNLGENLHGSDQSNFPPNTTKDVTTSDEPGLVSIGNGRGVNNYNDKNVKNVRENNVKNSDKNVENVRFRQKTDEYVRF